MPFDQISDPNWSKPTSVNPLSEAITSALQTMSAGQKLQGGYYENLINKAKAQYAPEMSLAELQKAQAEPGLVRAQTGQANAQAGYLGSETGINRYKLENAIDLLLNPEKAKTQLTQAQASEIPAEIEYKKAQAKYYSQGGGRGGVQNALENAFQNGVLADNPHITDPDKQREAINVVSAGGDKLSDGTPVNPMSEITRRAYDRSLKTTTTAQAINQNLQANQASAELPVYDKYINEGVEPYGTTVFGYSQKQISDALDTSNHAAQTRVGKYIAAQQLLYDKSALMLKINALPPGVRLANEVKKLASQSINAKFPTQSEESRQVASETVSKALLEGLEARNKYGVGASGAFHRNNTNTSKNIDYTKLSDDELRSIVNG